MALKPYPDFCTGTYRGRSEFLGNDRCINLVPELIQSGTGKGKYGLSNVPGKTLFATLASGAGRGIWSGDEAKFFAVAGSRLYDVTDPGASVTDRGSVESDSKPVNIFHNGVDQLAVVSNQKLWVDNGAGPSAITTCPAAAAAGGAGVAMGTMVDGYGVVVEKDTNNIFLSGLNAGLGTGDFTSWDPLDKLVWYGAQDRISMIIGDADHNLWVMGRKSGEAFQNAGGSGFPFQRIPGTAMNTGLAAPFAWAFVPGPSGTDQLCFLAQNDRGGVQAVAMRGVEPITISTAGVESFWDDYTTSDAVAFGYIRAGHRLFQINFPTSNAGWVYDFQTGMWHERYSGAPNARVEPVGRFHTAPVITRSHFLLSGTTGKVYKDSYSVYQEESAAINWEITPPALVGGADQNIAIGTLRLDIEVGVGGSSGDTVTLENSYDNGKNFGAARTAPLGPSGATRTTVEWHRNGAGRTYQPRIRGSVNRRVAISMASVDAEPGLGY